MSEKSLILVLIVIRYWNLVVVPTYKAQLDEIYEGTKFLLNCQRITINE